jgi:arsenite-transporting ATPase
MSRVVMFAGKGGVGKTTCAAAAALHFATGEPPVLAVSTDATPSLTDIFTVNGRRSPVAVSDSLHISELGLDEIREMWDRKFGRDVYAVFASFVEVGYPEFVDFMTSLLPGLGDEFMLDYIRELSGRRAYGTIIWDTAPLGQTLALLQTPGMLAEHLKMAPRIYSRLKVGRDRREPVLDIIRRWAKLSDQNMAFLRQEVEFTLVAIPEALSVAQLDGIFRELAGYGLAVGRLVVNNVVCDPDSAFLEAKAAQQQVYLETIYNNYGHLDIIELPLFPYEIRGRERLAEVAGRLYPGEPVPG